MISIIAPGRKAPMARLTVAYLLIICTMALGAAPTEPPPPAASGRSLVALDGEWECALDPTGQAPPEAWAMALPDPASAQLPHVGQQHLPGALWYAREITLPGNGEVQVQFNLRQLLGTLDLFLDGELLATLQGDGLPQRVQTRGVGGSVHRLALRWARTDTDADGREASVGLGHMSMELLSPIRIQQLAATIDPVAKTVIVRYRLAAPAPVTAVLRLEVLSADARRTWERQNVTLQLTETRLEGERVLPSKRFLRWSPATPTNIYRLRATLQIAGRTIDSREITCGACDISVTSAGWLLNGTPLHLKGLRLPDSIPALAGESPVTTLRHELQMAQQAGFNAIMAEGAALSEEALTLADALGLLVIGEIPLARGYPAIRAALEASAHHPCIIAWSWAGGDAPANAIAQLRAWDPARPILVRDGPNSQLINARTTAAQTITVLDDRLASQAPDTWWRQYTQLEEAQQPVIVTGLGAQSAPLASAAAQHDSALRALRLWVESLRRARQFPLLGYFVRLPAAETLTGLSTPAGTPTPSFTTALAFNQPCVLTWRLDTRVAVGEQAIRQATLLNDQVLTGDLQLYLVVTHDGQTSITVRTITLSGESAQDIRRFLSFIPARPGTYRLQAVLSRGDEVIASTQTLTLSCQ